MCNTDGDGQQLLLQFTNCRLVRDHKLVQDDLWVRNGRIINPEPVFFDERAKAHQRINCGGAIIAPGYIDIQINGKHMLTPNTLTSLLTHTPIRKLELNFAFNRLPRSALNSYAAPVTASITAYQSLLILSQSEFATIERATLS